MFIRHGEKPAEDGPPHGVTHHGKQDEHSLSVRGWTRAGALAGLFAQVPTPAHPQLIVPELVIATKFTDGYRSRRELETATPLAQRLGLQVDEFELDRAKSLSQSVAADARPTLVVWHHGAMVELLGHFPVSNKSDIPKSWPDDRFDLIWVLSRETGSQDYQFTVQLQGLLDKDGAQ